MLYPIKIFNKLLFSVFSFFLNLAPLKYIKFCVCRFALMLIGLRSLLQLDDCENHNVLWLLDLLMLLFNMCHFFPYFIWTLFHWCAKQIYVRSFDNCITVHKNYTAILKTILQFLSERNLIFRKLSAYDICILNLYN